MGVFEEEVTNQEIFAGFCLNFISLLSLAEQNFGVGIAWTLLKAKRILVFHNNCTFSVSKMSGKSMD